MFNDNNPSKGGHEYSVNGSRYSVSSLDVLKKNADLSHPQKELSYAQSERDVRDLTVAAAHAAIPNWTNIVLMVSLIFGGCCANVRDSKAMVEQF